MNLKAKYNKKNIDVERAMEPPAECTKETRQDSENSQKVKVNLPKSKDKLCNDHKKVKSISKLPRIVRSPSSFYKKTKSTPKLREPLDDAGDAIPGTSKMVHIPTKLRKEESPEKSKPSYIPRRKSTNEGSKEIGESSKNTHNNQFLPECRNVQRIHMLINPDFCPEEHTQPASVASTRPIPTLGQIYGRINMIDSDRLNEWFMEINTPMSSTTGHRRTVNFEASGDDIDCNASTIASPAHCHQEDLRRSTIVLDRKEMNLDGFGTGSTTNDNVNVWLSSDLESPTRDSESGYQTMSYSPPQKLTSKASIVDGPSVNTNTTYCLGLTDDPLDMQLCTTDPNVECSAVNTTCRVHAHMNTHTDTSLPQPRADRTPSSLLREQPTVVICRTPESMNNKIEEGTGMSKHININTKQSSSEDYGNVTIATPVQRMPVSSYTECLSEILQKTTNFENAEGSIECPKTPSSLAVTDIEVRDNLSNEGTVDQLDELCALEEQSNLDWSRNHCLSSANVTFTHSDGTGIGFSMGNDWSSKYRSEGSEPYTNSSGSDNRIKHWNAWKQEISRRYFDDRYVDAREGCKKCQRFKRFPSSRFTSPRSLGSWRRRISFRRICRRRWNYVWKKTAERWALWSSRSPAKFRKFRVMQCLQRSIVWEDADVQTTILVYNEMGTDSALKEQKSAAIGTVLNMGSWQTVGSKADSVVKSGSKDRPKFRHVNLGPSMFPFLYNSKKKSLTIQTSDKGQSRSHLLYYTNKEGRHSARQSDNITWNVEHGVDMDRPVKSCQYEESIPENVERSTSLIPINELNMSDVYTDTEDLRYYMNDKVTSTAVRYNTYRLLNAVSKDACTQKVITCNNAEADVKFMPHLESMSTGTVTSACDITYYRPLTGTDITHLVTETRTQQALYPILKNYILGPNVELVTREPSVLSETQTQMSPDRSVHKVSMGVTTSKPTVTQDTDVNTEDAPVIQKSIEIKNCSTQIQAPVIISETQMSPIASISKTSMGISPSNPKFTGKRTSSFISACVLMDGEKEKENYAVQTSSHKPKLACTATKIMSISSRQLTDKYVSSTEVSINKPPHRSTGNLLQPTCSCKMSKVATCGTERKHGHECSRSTSSRGIESYYETEILLNNLIKKALVGDNGPLQRQLSPNHDSRHSTKACSHVSTGSNAIIGLETKAIGPTLSEIRRLDGSGEKIDTGIQYSMLDKSGRPEMDFRRSAPRAQSQLLSMCMLNQQTTETNTQTDWNTTHNLPLLLSVCSSAMTSSYCGLTHAKRAQETNTTKTIADNPGKPYECASVTCNTETNTDFKFSPNFEQPQKVSSDKRPLEVPSYTPRIKSLAELQNNLNSQLLSLSRMIGKRRPPSATINPAITTSVFSADYAAEKWISSGKTFTSLVGFEASPAEDMKTNTLYLTRALQSDDENSNRASALGPPTVILSRDSLADVLPVKKSINFNCCLKKVDTPQCVTRVMIDQVTSDENVAKDVKESILQACPDICETGTESLPQVYEKKSASVLTTQCVLPTPLPCTAERNTEQRGTECVFVYGEPKCAIHKHNADVSVQFFPPCDQEVNVMKQCVNQSVGMLTPYSTIPEEINHRKPHALIGEVLSPKVYKALYETTKLVVSEDASPPPVKEKVVVTYVDAGVEAAKFHVPDVRSAGVVTSMGRGFGFPQRCYCRDRGTHPSTKCALYHVARGVETAEIAPTFTHAKLLQMPEENNPGCIEDCMKTHLVSSCRYYSNLLTKKLGRVKDNLTKHLAQPVHDNVFVRRLPCKNTEACTMKPSGKEEFASQTIKFKPKHKLRRHMSCILSPVVSLTDICKNDKKHLKSVYYMLSAIEGRLRRLNIHTPLTYV